LGRRRRRRRRRRKKMRRRNGLEREKKTPSDVSNDDDELHSNEIFNELPLFHQTPPCALFYSTTLWYSRCTRRSVSMGTCRMIQNEPNPLSFKCIIDQNQRPIHSHGTMISTWPLHKVVVVLPPVPPVPAYRTHTDRQTYCRAS
jgi:hypothetical protein